MQTSLVFCINLRLKVHYILFFSSSIGMIVFLESLFGIVVLYLNYLCECLRQLQPLFKTTAQLSFAEAVRSLY